MNIILLKSFFFEAFLKRLSLSKYADRFVFKGGFFIAPKKNSPSKSGCFSFSLLLLCATFFGCFFFRIFFSFAANELRFGAVIDDFFINDNLDNIFHIRNFIHQFQEIIFHNGS